jgi:hypothetical protein
MSRDVPRGKIRTDKHIKWKTTRIQSEGKVKRGEKFAMEKMVEDLLIRRESGVRNGVQPSGACAARAVSVAQTPPRLSPNTGSRLGQCSRTWWAVAVRCEFGEGCLLDPWVRARIARLA